MNRQENRYKVKKTNEHIVNKLQSNEDKCTDSRKVTQ